MTLVFDGLDLTFGKIYGKIKESFFAMESVLSLKTMSMPSSKGMCVENRRENR